MQVITKFSLLLFCSLAIMPQNHPFGPKAQTATALTALAYLGHSWYQKQCKNSYVATPKQKLPEKPLPANAPIITLFVHGLGGSKKTGIAYQRHGFIPGDVMTFDFPDSPSLTQPQAANLGQDIDIEVLKTAYLQAVSQGYRVILYGLSRGAATIINFLGIYDVDNVVAALVESPFFTVKDVVHNQLRSYYLHWIPGLATLGSLVTALLHRNYNPYGIHPGYVVTKIQSTIPLLFICSEQDRLVPAATTIALHQKRKAAGCSNTHLIVLKRGAHGIMLKGEAAHIYRAGVHAFLRNYRLPYNANFFSAAKRACFRSTPHA